MHTFQTVDFVRQKVCYIECVTASHISTVCSMACSLRDPRRDLGPDLSDFIIIMMMQ